MKDTTDFGFTEVPTEEKVKKVAGVFSSVAKNYDVMNDVMSLGVHRLWKKTAVELAAIRPGQQILDLAGGTGDMTKQFSRKVGDTGHVILSDINPDMLEQGRQRLINQGICSNVSFELANAEALPFDDNQFDRICISFGLRNVTDKDKALREMYRCLKPTGQLIVLEFSKPVVPGLGKIYDAYSFKLLPLMGKLIAKDADSYQYLAESIRMHPDQHTLEDMILNAGFDRCKYHNLSGGIVALHRGFKS